MKRQSKPDWGRVHCEAKADAPIAYDPEVDSYDPNDEKAVDAYWKGATVRHGENTASYEAVRRSRYAD